VAQLRTRHLTFLAGSDLGLNIEGGCVFSIVGRVALVAALVSILPSVGGAL